MLELGRAGTSGRARGEAPVLRHGAVVAVLRASGWREAATAVVGDREWVFGKHRGELRGRWAADPEDAVRLRASRVSFWKGTWVVDLEGRRVEVERVSRWRSAHRFRLGGRQVAIAGSTGGWRPRRTLDADDALRLHEQVFLLWMQTVLDRRNDAAIGAATTAAVVGGSS